MQDSIDTSPRAWSEHEVSIAAADGVRLAARLYLPLGDGPFATLMEALPYRKDDITSSYADSYHRFAGQAGFAVLRLDLRGTGSSGGTLDDEYTDLERADLRAAIEWIAAQPWSSGRVGMLGTSYSGFNSLHMAMDGVPQLGAIVATYATDDRYTDDVHYMGGALRQLDLIDYPLYMVAMNALPPVPAVWGDDWVAEWHRRIRDSEPWLLEWLRAPLATDVWRRGSIRLGPGSAGYERIGCPTMLIAGWADGYRNNTFRTIEHLQVPWRLLAGPWVHKDPSVARPAPNVDSDAEIIAFFDEHLRGGPPSVDVPGQVFVRAPVGAQPDLALHPGRWVQIDRWPHPGLTWRELRATGTGHQSGVEELVVEGDVGAHAWNSCGGGLPWGQSLDQRIDNARSITYDWDHTVCQEMMGTADVRLRVRSSATAGHVSVKLCDVAPDGTSALITRGYLDLEHRGCWPQDAWGEVGAAPRPLVPGEWIDVRVEFEATTWTLVPGHRLRLAVAGTDWPNCWPAREQFTLGVDRESIVLSLPVVEGLEPLQHTFGPGPGPSSDDADGVEWRYEHDVLARETRAHTLYGGPYRGFRDIAIDDHYEGHVGISTVDCSQGWVRGRSRLQLSFPEAVCTTEATLEVTSDSDAFDVTIHLTVEHDGVQIAERHWHERFGRTPAP
jgi:predicted acyl esterase